MSTVTVEWYEFVTAVHHAADMFAYEHAAGLRHHPPLPREDWLRVINNGALGASAEIVAARLTGKPWVPALGPCHTGDLAGGVEVRGASKDDDEMPLRDGDNLDAWWLFIVGKPPRVRCVGRVWGHDAVEAGTVRDPGGRGPATFVPQSAFKPL